MATIDVVPTSGTFYGIAAYVDGSLAFLALNGNEGHWSGAAENIHIAAVGNSGATYACTVGGTKKSGAPFPAHAAVVHTLSVDGHFSETL